MHKLKIILLTLLSVVPVLTMEGRYADVIGEDKNRKAPSGHKVNSTNASEFLRLPEQSEKNERPQLRVRLGHFRDITAITFSRNGEIVATGSRDRLVRLWEVATGRELRRFVGHTLDVTSIAFSEDEQQLVTASKDGTARIWNAATGAEIKKIEIGEKYSLEMAQVSPNGKFAAAATLIGRNVHLFDLKNGRELRTLTNSYPLQKIAFSSDDSLIATYERAVVHVWNTATGNKVVDLVGHTKAVSTITFAAKDQKVITSSVDKTIRIWAMPAGNEIKRFDVLTRSPEEILVYPDNQYIAVLYSLEEHLQIRELETGKEVGSLKNGTEPIEAVAITANEKYLAVGGRDHIVRFWDPLKREEIDRLESASARVAGVAFSSDNKFFASASGDGIARVWEFATGRELKQLSGHEGAVTSIAFSPNNQYIVTSSEDKTARLWDVATGQQLKILTGHTDTVNAAAFSPDGALVITGSNDKTVRIWRVEDGQEIKQFTVDYDGAVGVTSVAFSSNGRLVIANTMDGEYIWDVASKQEIERLEGNAGEVGAVAISPDKKLAAIGYKLWDIVTGKVIRHLMNAGSVNALAFSPNGELLLTGDRDGLAQIWDVSTGQELRRLKGHEDRINSVAFSPDGHLVATGSDDQTARIWDAKSGAQLNVLNGHAKDVNTVAFLPDGRLVTSGDDATVRIWNAIQGAEKEKFEGPAGSDPKVACSPDGQLLAIGSDSSIQLLEITSGQTITTIREPGKLINSFAFSPDGKQLVSVGWEDGTLMNIRFWDVTTGKETKNIKGHKGGINSVAFSRDGTLMITGSDDRTALLWNPSNGQQVQEFIGHGDSSATALSPDGKIALTGGPDSDGILWDVASGKIKRKLIGHTELVSAVAFSADGKLALTGSADNTARLWDVDTGREIRRFIGHTSDVNAVAFSQDGQLILTGSSDCTMRIWKRDSETEVSSMISLTDGTWVIVTPDGRFDTNNLEQIKGLHWVMPDDPFTPLSPEIFMRPLFEPRLLPRLLAKDHFRDASIADLNRVQPKVTITSVRKDGPDTAEVTVEVEDVERRFQREKTPVVESGAKDLRLFRDGQLINYRDGDLLGKQQSATTGCEPIAGSAKKCKAVFEHVRLPQQEGVKEVEFSAYAFNTSDVKSDTSRCPFTYAPGPVLRRGRVYLINVGVSKYENPAWNLAFSASDAHLVSDTVSARLRATKEYDDVVDVLLTSEEIVINGQSVLKKNATKENFRKVLRLLAGEKFSPEELSDIAGADRVEKATPEDIVLIFFSSHGYRDTERFYLFPYDTGPGEGRDPEAVIPRSISSDDLYLWLRDVDAGNMVLIIDACHAAAAVKSGDFKPGPMGSRGMGQLAYDKGMRILAATQPDTTAAEVNDIGNQRKIQHGLLTYALVEDGLVERKANSNDDKVILLPEWLEYGVRDVPKLYEEVLKCLNNKQCIESNKGGGIKVRFVSKGEGDITSQQPSLFDFTEKIKRKRQIPIDKF
jgi:WD40 repeat protein